MPAFTRSEIRLDSKDHLALWCSRVDLLLMGDEVHAQRLKFLQSAGRCLR
jgi:hypothetical protein